MTPFPKKPQLTLQLLDGKISALEVAVRGLGPRVDALEAITENDRFEERLSKLEALVGSLVHVEEPQKQETE